MKKVVYGEALYAKMAEAVALLGDTVKSTLGPQGCNAIINHSAFSPFITNDGVTIASNIESDDPVVNVILELAKEAAIKTNEVVGDGTTTTIVLLQSIFENGLELIKTGYNPLVLKKELNQALTKIIPEIQKLSWQPNCQELGKIASISASSEEIGKNILEAYIKVRNKEAITIKEGVKEEDEIIHKQGYVMESMLASPYFLKNASEINLNNSKVLIVNDYLDNLESLSFILNNIIENKDSLVILALDFSEEFINTILNLVLEENLDIVLLKLPGYGTEKLNIMHDLALITGANITSILELKEIDVGSISHIKINEQETILAFAKSKRIKEAIDTLKTFDRRQAMLENGLIEIRVGALTDTEKREKKMRYDDSLNAIFAAANGVILGSGVTIYQVSENLKEESQGALILKKALTCPLRQVLNNAGLNSEKIIKDIIASNFTKVYNVNNNTLEIKNDTLVIDPLDVVLYSLKNAVSIASMLLTTKSLIINEYVNNLNKENNYNEM